jgi:hypothetical protein
MFSKIFQLDRDYTLKSVPGDGNCFFHVISNMVHKTITNLRQMVYDELTSNAMYEPFTCEQLTNVLIPRYWDGTLGDLIPPALARALNQTIFILFDSATDSKWYYLHPAAGRTGNPIYLYLKCDHYHVFVPTPRFLEWEDSFYEH